MSSPYLMVDKDSSLRQGQIVLKVPHIRLEELKEKDGKPDISAKPVYFDVIILTQSCDLDEDPVETENVYVCPIHPYSPKHSNGEWGELSKNRRPGFHLLDKIEDGTLVGDHYVVAFGQGFTIPLKILKSIAQSQDRYALQSPYLEALSQRFGLYFSRVARENPFPKIFETTTAGSGT